MALSERQSRILSFLNTFTLDNGYPPTIREIGKAVGITSTSVVNYNLDALNGPVSSTGIAPFRAAFAWWRIHASRLEPRA